MNYITITYDKKNDDGQDEKIGLSINLDDIKDYDIGSVIDCFKRMDPTEANILSITKTTDEAVIVSKYKRETIAIK